MILPWDTMNFKKYFGKKIRFSDGVEGHISEMYYLSGGVVGVQIEEEQPPRTHETFLYENDFVDHLLEPVDPIMCENCGKRKATQIWVGEGGTLSFVHGGGQNWCERCCVETQLKHAEEVATRIPELKEKLKELRRQEIKNSILEAEKQGLYETSEHLTSQLELWENDED
jgi:hypothetical protein